LRNDLAAIVLGAAAGGGFPQWNCRCATCRLAWAGDVGVKPRTQASLAVTGDGEHWILLNASPDLRAQIQATPALQPRDAVRGSPIAAVVLTGAEVDQTAGLLTLRERQSFALFATAETHAALAANTIFGVLDSSVVGRETVALNKSFKLPGGLQAELFAVPGKVALYLEGDNPDLSAETGANLGVELAGGQRRLLYVPGAAGAA
jgi:pyrroloquinoline quinone biosynthesis protein B